MYVAVKGGETAILNSYELLARQRRGLLDREARQGGAARL